MSCIRMTLVECEHFGPGSVQARLDASYKRFTEFCRRCKISCSQPPFTEKMELWQIGVGNWFNFSTICSLRIDRVFLSFELWRIGVIWLSSAILLLAAQVCKKNGEILLTVKAYCGRCITEWLASEMLEASRNHRLIALDDRIPAMSICVHLGNHHPLLK